MTFPTLNLILRGNPCAHFSDSYSLMSYEMYTWSLLYIMTRISPMVEAMREAGTMCHFVKF